MSYPGVDPTDTEPQNPVGAQDVSGGVTTEERQSFVADDRVPPGHVVPKEYLDPPKPVQPTMSDEELKAAAAKAVEDMFAVTPAWQAKKVTKFKVDCPSGQTVLLKYLDTFDLLEHDLIEELDFFTRKLFPAELDASGNPVEAQSEVEENIWAALRDPKKRRRFLDMTGKLIATASLDPKVVHDGVALVDYEDEATGETKQRVMFGHQMTVDQQIQHFKKPIPPLRGNASYSGPIDFADRMAIFQELNKPLGMIEPFREESAAVLPDLARGEGSGGEAQ